MPWYFVGGTRTASAGSGLGFNPLTLRGTIAHTVTGCAENTFKFFATAFRALELYFFIWAHNQQLNKFLAF